MAEKVDNIKDAFSVQVNIVKDKTVLIIDDIYHSGLSMNELARTLFNAGAREVLGLAATKTFRDLPDDS
jgi:competence protein ComFC